jgi:hypothetical protein
VNGRGGGGGGGAQEDLAWMVIPGSTVAVTVGSGGAGAYYGPAYLSNANDQFVNTVPGTNGGSSSFGALTSLGGGAGSGSYGGGTINAGNGGSGGGCAGCASAGQGTAGQGHAGSTDGGGGGAGGVAVGWNGGPGITSDITGVSITYGGGGGGGLFPDNARLSDFSNDKSIGGAGGSGVVIVRYSAPRPPPPPPPPPEPAGPPRDVVGVASDKSATFSCKPPTSSGSFAVTYYLLTTQPGAKTCLLGAHITSCQITGLANGTAYTATVRAFTGAGWGALSDPSPPVTPTAPPPPSISVVADRSARAAGVVSVRGSSTPQAGVLTVLFGFTPGDYSCSVQSMDIFGNSASAASAGVVRVERTG